MGSLPVLHVVHKVPAHLGSVLRCIQWELCRGSLLLFVEAGHVNQMCAREILSDGQGDGDALVSGLRTFSSTSVESL